MAQGQDGRLRSNRNIVAGPDLKFAAVEKASEIDDIPLAQMNFPSVQKPATTLNGRSRAEAAQIHPKPGMADRARRQPPDYAVIKPGRETADEET